MEPGGGVEIVGEHLISGETDADAIDEITETEERSHGKTTRKDSQAHIPLVHELERVRKMLACLRCRFFPGTPRKTFIINMIVVTSVVLIRCFFNIKMILKIASYSIDNKALINSMVYVVFNLQTCANLGFIYYWQRSQAFKKFVRLLHRAQNSAGCIAGQPQLRRIIRFFYVIMFFIVILLIFKHAILVLGSDLQIIDRQFMEAAKQEKYPLVLSFAMMLYTILTFCIVLFLYLLFVYGAVLEVEFFNNRLASIDSDEHLLANLVQLIHDHAKLSEAIRALDASCEIYAFCMIGSTIPVTVFSVLNLMTARNLPFINVVAAVPSVLFCVLQLISLTAIPALLHNALDKSKHHLYGNIRIWRRFDKDVYHVASSLATHLNQPDLGVSVWGFAVVSKPLILTTISIIVTCMAFMLEFRRRSPSMKLFN